MYSFFIPDTGSVVLILQETSSGISSDDPRRSIDFMKSNLEEISNNMINNFLERNSQPAQLSTDMNLGTQYKLLNSDELRKITSQPNWGEILTQTYPGSHGTPSSHALVLIKHLIKP